MSIQSDLQKIYPAKLRDAVEASCIKNNVLAEPVHKEALATIFCVGMLEMVKAGKMEIVGQLATTQLLVLHHGYDSSAFKKRHNDDAEYVHFAYWKEPKAGDLVLAKTGHVSAWKVGFYVEKLPGDYGGAVIRAIGSGMLCNYSNEDFVPIVGIYKDALLESVERKMFERVHSAFRKGDEYRYRFGGVDFTPDQTMTVTVREVWSGVLGGDGKQSAPFTVTMKYQKNTSVKFILSELRKGGYGSKKFERTITPTPTPTPATPS